MAVAVTPETYCYDPDTLTFTLNYTPDPAIAAPTLVFTAPRQYPGGYRVEIDGGRIVSADGAPVLVVQALPGAATVRVSLQAATLSRSAERRVGNEWVSTCSFWSAPAH